MSRWLVTRPIADARSLAAALEARGHTAVVAPIMEIAPRDAPDVDLGGVQALLFTSQNGVRAFAAAESRRDLPALAVGRSTADAAQAAGFAQVDCAEGDSEALAALAASRLDPAGGALLHVAGKQVAGDLLGRLEGAGFHARRAVLYEARAVDRLPQAAADALKGRKVAGALIFSPRTAEVFARLVAAAGLSDSLRGLVALCLSTAVAERLGVGVWGAVHIAARPELPALLDLLDSADAPTAGRQTQE